MSTPLHNKSTPSGGGLRSVFRRPHHHPQSAKKKPGGKRPRGSLQKEGSAPDLTESTLPDLGSSLSQLELRRNPSYETDASPATTRASTQPSDNNHHEDDDDADDFDRNPNSPNQRDYVPADAHPPPESVSLLRSGSCSELSEDEEDSKARRKEEESHARHRAQQVVGAAPAKDDDEDRRHEGSSMELRRAHSPGAASASGAFVPPEYIYLTPDNCWPLEL